MIKLIDSRTPAQILNDKIQACANVVVVQSRHPEWAKWDNVGIAKRAALRAVELSKLVAPDEYFTCQACGREESASSADPCPAVIADLEDAEPTVCLAGNSTIDSDPCDDPECVCHSGS